MSGDELSAFSLRDPVAFAGLVPHHGPALHGYLARRAPGHADDLLSETWLAAYAGRRTFDPSRGSARAWLFGVARHVLLAHLRRVAVTHAGAGAEHHAADVWDAVDQRLDAAALAPSLRAALARLTPTEREVLLLVAWEGLTPAEAATVAGVPAGTARSRLHRAREAMRRYLDPATPSAATPSAVPPPLPLETP